MTELEELRLKVKMLENENKQLHELFSYKIEQLYKLNSKYQSLKGDNMQATIEELKKSIERIKKYTALIPLVEKEQQSQFLHNIYLEADGIGQVIEEAIR